MVGKVTPNDMASASVVPTIMGLNQYASQNDALANAIDAKEGNPRKPFVQNEAMAMGDYFEPHIIALAAQRLELTDVNTDYDSAFFHKTLPLAASLDGTGVGSGVITTDTSRGIYCMNADQIDITGTGIIECKLTSNPIEDVPAPYRGPIQLQAQMMCTGHKWGAVCVLYRGTTLRIFVYKVNETLQDQITEAVIDFDRRLRDYDWYPVLSSDDGNVAYPRVDDGADEIDLDALDGASELLSNLVRAKRDKSIAEAIIDEAEAGLKEILGSHESAIGTVGNHKVVVKWPMKVYKAQPEKVTPAKPARVVRQKVLTVKEL